MSKEQRGNWGSSVGFILAASGSAIGLGNLWKFPYQAGRNGGGAFVIIYLAFVILLGFSLILGEMAIGRNGKKDGYSSYEHLKKGWGKVGLLGIITSFIILSYYLVIGGWIIKYLVDFLTNQMTNDTTVHFNSFISSDYSPILYLVLFLVTTSAIVLKGVSGGIEKASKIMMPFLFIFLIIIVIRSVTLPNAMVGIKFFLQPDFSKITAEVILSALGQVFFSLSLGMAIMVTYGSYLPANTNMVKSSFIIALLDTFVALLAGLAILPAVFSFGYEPTAGPSLMFITLPKVFEQLPFGNFFGFIFFLLVLFAALTSAVSLLEVSVAYLVDKRKFDRKKAVIFLSVVLFILALPSSLSFGRFHHKIFFGQNFFDFLGYLTDNIFLPLGGLLLCIFIGFVWDKKEVEAEVTNNGKIKFVLLKTWLFLIKYIIPIIIFCILLKSIGIL